MFVPTTDELTAPEFATETATSNSLGADDALLLVAIDDRTDAIWVAEGLDEITDGEIDDIIADRLEPQLRDGDFGGAVIATIDGLRDARRRSPDVAPEPTDAPERRRPPADTGSGRLPAHR